jgi:hypothetical protein
MWPRRYRPFDRSHPLPRPLITVQVKYADSQNISFLAVNGGHGAITTVGKLHGGIEIWLNQLSSVEIAQDGATAKIGGGTLSKTVTDSLWAHGKQTGVSKDLFISLWE